MPRLRNGQSGAVVSCSDETAARLGGEWKSAASQPPKAQSRRPASRKPESE